MFGVLEQTQVYTYPLNFIWLCSLCRLLMAKNHNFGKILTFLGATVPTSFYRWGPNLVCYRRPTVCTYLPNIVSISLFYRPLAAKTHNFCHIFDFGIQWCRQLPTVWESWARLQNYKPSPIQWYQNRFCTPTPSWRNRAHKLWRSKAWRTDRQTDKQTNKKSTFLATPAAGEIRAPPNLAWW